MRPDKNFASQSAHPHLCGVALIAEKRRSGTLAGGSPVRCTIPPTFRDQSFYSFILLCFFCAFSKQICTTLFGDPWSKKLFDFFRLQLCPSFQNAFFFGAGIYTTAHRIIPRRHKPIILFLVYFFINISSVS